MGNSNQILSFENRAIERAKRKIEKMTPEQRDTLLASGTEKERIFLVEMEYRLNLLAKDSSPEVRKAVVIRTGNYEQFFDDPSHIVRLEVAKQLKNISECVVPQIEFDNRGFPYVVETPERVLLQKMTSDISTAVAHVAKKALDNLKQREVKEAAQKILAKNGMENVSYSFGRELNIAIERMFLNNEVDELPVKELAKKDREVGVDR